MRTDKSHNIFLLAFTAFVLFFVFLYFFTPFYSYFTVEKITQFIHSNDEHILWLFWLINFIAVLLFIPLTLFWIIAGMLFGTITGTLLTASASTVAATIAFILCRLFENQFDQLINKNDAARQLKTKLNNKIEKNSFTILFIIRVLPHPFILFSYIAGFAKTIRLDIFILATLTAILPISFTFVLLGSSLLKDPKALIVPVVLIILVTQLPKIFKKLTRYDL